MLRYWLFQAHWIVGITAGVILAFVGATGAMLSFETEIVSRLNRDVRVLSNESAAILSPADLLERIAASNPERRVVSLTVFGDRTLKPRVTFAAAVAGARPGSRGDAYYVDPVSGQVSAARGNRGEDFFRNVRTLHRWLTLEASDDRDRDRGRQVVGLCTLLLLGLVLTGLYLRWPRGRSTQWRVWLTFSRRVRARQFLWHLHAIVATWVLPFYLVMALTGLYWSYEWYRDGLVALFDASPPKAGSEPGRSPGGAHEPSEYRPQLDRAWQSFTATTPDRGFQSATIEWSTGAREVVSIRFLAGDAPHPRAFDSIKINPADGAVLETRRYADKGFGDRLLASIFPLHSGRYFGTFGVLAFMLASLCMPLFAVTGWLLYLARRRRRATARWTVASAE